MTAAMKDLVRRQKKAVLNQRRRNLLNAITQQGGVWTTGHVLRLYVANGWGCNRSTARHDLRHLTNCGLLTQYGPTNDRSYRLRAVR